MSNINIISASAGSGKTYRLSELLCDEIASGRVRPEAVMATTFTKKAAAELQERVRRVLINAGMPDMAQRLAAAKMGTIHSVCGRIVSDFAFEKGLFPFLSVLDESLSATEFRRSLSSVLDLNKQNTLAQISYRLDGFNWEEDVQEVLRRARANGFSAPDIQACKERSIADFISFLGAPEDGDHEGALNLALSEFIELVDTEKDQTKKTATFLETVRQVKQQLDKGYHLKWSNWVKLTKLEPAKKSLKMAGPIHTAAAVYDSHPLLHDDITKAISFVYDLAAEALVYYQQYKRQWGVLDYSDQEVLALELLNEEFVLERLKDDIELLLVDEFQDTSPIQLAILLKLADIANKTVWVGDQKQSIFGFRGTDPALMDACIESLFKDKPPETLTLSWRSRPELVEITSDIFVRGFSDHGFTEDLVRLKAAHPEEPPDLGPVMEYWVLNSKNKKNDAKAVAAGIKGLLEDFEVKVIDKKTRSSRNVSASDVGVLCRTNQMCQNLANELEALSIKAELPGTGLIDSPEARLMIAGLRLWVDKDDTLSAAEIARIIHYPDKPDDWLSRVLEKPGKEAFESISEVVRIINLAKDNDMSGALAAFDQIVEAMQIRELCLSWGDAAARLNNLEDLRRHAVKYTDTCLAQGIGCTPAGLIAHYQALQDKNEDTRMGLSGEDAVTVVTWHRAKGLEWPITVLFELDKKYEPSPLGVKVISDRQGFDLSDPLDGRWVRYLPYLDFNKQKNTAFQQRLSDHLTAAAVIEQETRQELRLLYVGWTRARDRLVLTSRSGKLNSGILGLLHDDGRKIISEPESGQVSWAGRDLDIIVRHLEPSEPVSTIPEPGSDYMAKGPVEYPPARISPSMINLKGTAGEHEKIGSRIIISGNPDMNSLGEAIHLFFAADEPWSVQSQRIKMASNILKRWNVAAAIKPESLLQSSDSLQEWIADNYPDAVLHKEWPVKHRLENGSIVSGDADLVLENDNTFTIIDHKSFPGTIEDSSEKASSFAGQLFSYADAVSTAIQKDLESCYIHFPISGLIIPVYRTEG